MLTAAVLVLAVAVAVLAVVLGVLVGALNDLQRREGAQMAEEAGVGAATESPRTLASL